MKNLFADIPTDVPDELTETLCAAESVRIERIVSDGHASPADQWYDQSEHEWVAVLAGTGTLRFADADEAVVMKPGDSINIPAHRRHRVESTADDQKTVWLAIFYR